MAVVLDASVALAWLVPSQMTAASEAFRVASAKELLLAPSAFRMEMRHALIKLERRGLVGSHALDAGLPGIEGLLEIAPEPGSTELVAAVAIAREESLGFQDALYLGLAIERKVDISTRDAALIEAARRRGVGVRDLR